MRRPTPLLLTLAALLLTACGSTAGRQRYDVEPIEPVGALDFDYAGEISTTGLPEPAEFPAEDAPESDGSTDLLRLRARVLSLPRDVSAAVLGSDLTAQEARRVARPDGEALFVHLEALPVSSVQHDFELNLRRGRTAFASASNVTSYVESFDLEVTGGVAFADPRVRLARDGMQLSVRTGEGADAPLASYELELHVSQLQRPIAESEGKVPGLDEPIRVQTPLFTSQTLVMRAEVSDAEACLLGPIPSFEAGRVLLVLVTADLVAADAPVTDDVAGPSAQ